MVRSLVMGMVLLGVPTSAGAQARLAVGNAAGAPDSTVSLSVTMTSSSPVGGVQFDISYKPSVLTLLGVSSGPTAVAAGKSTNAKSLSSDTFRVLVAGLNTNAIPDGTLAILEFRINPGADPGRTAVLASNFLATSPAGVGVTPALTTAGFVDVEGTSTTTTTGPTTSTTLPDELTELVVGECGGSPGSTITIDAKFFPQVKISALQFDVVFDPGVLNFQAVSTGPAATDASKTVQTGSLGPGIQRIVIIGLNQAVISRGIVAFMEFLVAADAEPGKTPITLINLKATTPQGISLSALRSRPGRIEIVPPPVLSRLSPESGPPQSLLVLAGKNLGSCTQSAVVMFRGPDGYRRQVIPVEATARRLVVEVPGDAPTAVDVSLSVGGANTNSLSFNVDRSIPFNDLTTELGESTSLGSNASPAGAAFNRRTNTAYIADDVRGIVTAIDVASRTVIQTAAVGSRPTRLSVNSVTGQVVVVNSGSENVSVLDQQTAAGLQNLGQISVGRNPQDVAINPLTNHAVVANQGDDTVSIIDLNTRSVVARIPVGSQPSGVAVDTTDNLAFVANSGDGSISVIDLSTHRVTDNLPEMGLNPRALAYHLESRNLIVGSDSGLLIRNMLTGQLRQLLNGQPVSEIVVHPTQDLAAAISNVNGTITPFRLTTALLDSARAELGRVAFSDLTVTGVALNPFTNKAIFAHRSAPAADLSGISLENGDASGFSRMSIPISLNFPRILLNPTDILGVAISNPTPEEASLQLTAIGASGQQLQGSDVSNPTTVVLPASGQVASLDFQLFGGGIGSSGDFWFHVAAPNPGLKALFLTGDFVNSIVGTEESGALFNDSILPAVRPGDEIVLSVINPLPVGASVTLDLVNDDGTILQSLSPAIAARGLLQDKIQNIFSSFSQVGSGAYVRVRSLIGVRSYEQFVPSGRLDAAGLNSQSTLGGSTELFFSHFVAGSDLTAGIDYETRAGIVNLESSAQTVRLTASDDQGNPLASTQTLLIPANGRAEPDLRSLFNFSTSRLTQGWLDVKGTGRLTGYLTYSTSEALAAVVSLEAPRTQLTFSQVAEEGTGFFTGLAVLNANSESASVDVAVFDQDGLQVGATSAPFTIPPGGRIVGLLNQLVGPGVVGQSGGYVQVTSSLPVHGIEIFGTANGKALANVPGQ